MAGESSLMFSIPTGKEVLTANGETSDNLMQGYDIKKHKILADKIDYLVIP